MTLQQLKYITLVAEKGNITDAAKALYISQPSLTAAIKELEKEMNIQIFDRTNKGVHCRQCLCRSDQRIRAERIRFFSP